MLRKFILTSALAGSLLALEPTVVTEAKAMTKAGKHPEAVAALEGALKTSPKDAVAIKAALTDANMALGDFNMFNEQMPPFRKYPAALRAYRQVLTYDKANKKAAANIKTIEDIYKSMGRPVPQ